MARIKCKTNWRLKHQDGVTLDEVCKDVSPIVYGVASRDYRRRIRSKYFQLRRLGIDTPALWKEAIHKLTDTLTTHLHQMPVGLTHSAEHWLKNN